MEELNKANEVEEAPQRRQNPMEKSLMEAYGITPERAVELNEISMGISKHVDENTDIGREIDESNYGALAVALQKGIEEHKDLTKSEKNFLLFDLGDQLGFKQGIFRRRSEISLMSILSGGDA